jgi:hypothetical protein
LEAGYPGALRQYRAEGVPDWFMRRATVEALVARGEMKFVEWRLSKGRRVPIAAAVEGDGGGGDGAAIFEHACRMDLKGIVAKRRDMAYLSGRVKSWLKIKNPKSPAAFRIEEGNVSAGHQLQDEESAADPQPGRLCRS